MDMISTGIEIDFGLKFDASSWVDLFEIEKFWSGELSIKEVESPVLETLLKMRGFDLSP